MSRNTPGELLLSPLETRETQTFTEGSFPSGFLSPVRSAFRPYTKVTNEDTPKATFKPGFVEDYYESINVFSPYNYHRMGYKVLNPILGVPINSPFGTRGPSSLPTPSGLTPASDASDKSQHSGHSPVEELLPNLKITTNNKAPGSCKDKKCCNCKKSRCLMLYCECFRSSVVC